MAHLTCNFFSNQGLVTNKHISFNTQYQVIQSTVVPLAAVSWLSHWCFNFAYNLQLNLRSFRI